MKNEVYDYFENLENKKISLTRNSKLKINHTSLEKVISEDNAVSKFKKGDKHYYLKPWKGNCNALHETASSNMYRHLGILTPPCYITKPVSGILSEDVRNLKNSGLLCTLAGNTPLQTLSNRIPEEFFIKNNWKILFNKHIQRYFLEFMTEECLDAYISKFLASEIRTDGDGHLGNLFLYKKINENGKVGEKFDGVIPIDLENSEVINFFEEYNRNNINAENFNKYLKTDRCYFGILGDWSDGNYEENIKNLREAISKGDVKQVHIDLLKNLLLYDFPGEIKKVARENKLNFKRPYECTSRLWEWHGDNLGKELGL